MRPFYKKILLVGTIVIAGLFLRIYEKTPSSLWTDEFATYWISSAPSISECIARATPTQGQSPFYFILEWMVLQVFPHTETSLRLLSLIASLISIYLVYEISLLLFEKKSAKTDSEEEKVKFFSLPAFFTTALFTLDVSQIYYAQEARPYALGIMFALTSQLFFLKLINPKKQPAMMGYIFFSALVCYTHYIFGTILLFQNIWVFLLLAKAKRDETKDREGKVQAPPITLKFWCLNQVAIIILLLPLFVHLVPILRNTSQWTWLKTGGFLYACEVFGSLFDFKFIMVYAIVFFLIFTFDQINSKKRKNLKQQLPLLLFLFIWFWVPPLFAYFATLMLNSSLLDARYMILSLIPFYLLAGFLIDILSIKEIKIFLASFIIFAYIGGVLIPLLKKEGRFCYRIPHDWRQAITVLNEALRPNDVIILRSGFIKENWIPETNDPIIIDYVKAPLNSFYYHPAVLKQSPGSAINVYNMTFSKETDFYPYYDSIFDVCRELPRVWMIGVNPPNTNYWMKQVPEIMRNSHEKAFEKNFSGVYLVLLVKRPEVYRMFKKK